MNLNKLGKLWTALLFLSLCIWTINPNSGTANIANLSISDLSKEESKQTADSQTLPPEVKSAVLEAASQQTSRTVAYLKILDSQPKDWSDGCLGLTEPGKVCVQNVVSGWQVEVTDGLRNWTYRTDKEGDLIKLDPSSE